MKNYWLLLIWLFIGGMFFSNADKQKEIVNGKKVFRWNKLYATLMILPYIIWAGFRSNVYGDTGAYRTGFIEIPQSIIEFARYFGGLKKDKGFTILSFIIKQFAGNSNVIYFLIIAAMQLLIFELIIRKYSNDYWMSLFLFVSSSEYLSWCHNGIRQFLGLMIIYAGTKWLIEKKYIPLVILILVASTMHASLLIMIPIIFIVQGDAWNTKSILCIFVTVIAVLFINQFTNLLDDALTNTQYSNMVTDWTEWNDNGMNPIRALVYSMPMILSILGLKIIRHENDRLINICVNMSILTSALSVIAVMTSGIFIGRMIIDTAVYSTFILLPWEIENLFTDSSKGLMRLFVIVGYLGFFYYQMHMVLGLV